MYGIDGYTGKLAFEDVLKLCVNRIGDSMKRNVAEVQYQLARATHARCVSQIISRNQRIGRLNSLSQMIIALCLRRLITSFG